MPYHCFYQPKRSALTLALHSVYRCSVFGFIAGGLALSQGAWADNGLFENVDNNQQNQLITEDLLVDTSNDVEQKRADFEPNAIQAQNLERLKQFYQPAPVDTAIDYQPVKQKFENVTKTLVDNMLGKGQQSAVCSGTWVYPAIQKHTTQQPTITQPTDSENNTNLNGTVDDNVYAEADYGYYDNTHYAELVGNVQVNQGNQQINADSVQMNLQNNVALAKGNVTILNDTNSVLGTSQANQSNQPVDKQGLISVANEIAYETKSTKATAKDVAFASVAMQAHGFARQLNKVDESHYEIDNVMFTTCAPENPTWQINAKSLDVNTETGRGEVYHATFKVKDTPVFYLPYFNFPVDDRRASGFLVPKAGFSNDGGLRLQTPYYFNLAPNYDVTLTPTIFSTRNPMLTGEFRYLTRDFGQGELTASYLPSDKEYGDEDRSRILFNHHWYSKSIPNLSAHALYQYVSDTAYFDDFDTLGLESNHLNLPRRVQVDYYNDYLTATAKAEAFQTIDKNVLDKDKPYSRLPQLSVKYRLPYFDNIDITGVSDFAYFKRPIDDNSAPEQSGGRMYNKISASYPIQRTWGYITPTASLQHLYTQYDEKTIIANNYTKDDKSQSVFVPEFSVDMGLNFYKAGSPFGKFDDNLGGYQLISPRLKYVYSPYKDQSNVPNFNTRIASLNFPQLYENSWFFGYERLADNNKITPSINYRYIDANGLTRLDASIGQQFYLSDIKVGLDSSTTPVSLDSSGTVVQLSSQPYQDFWIDLDGAINDNGSLNYYNAQLRFQPYNNALYNVGVIKRNEQTFIGQQKLSAITASAVFPISQNWGFLGAVQYDNLKNRYSDVLAGLTYESCCYGFAIYGRSYYNEFDSKPNNAVMAELNLNSIFNRRDGQLAGLMNERVLGINQLNRF